jgi:hypothetical protein
MVHDFDRIVERRGTGSSKWFRYPPDVLPLWVADMDFVSPEPVVRALRERVDLGVFGYGYQLELTELSEVFADRLHKRYGWRVSPETLVQIPGVIPGFNVACRMLASPGQGIVMQTPLYPPLLRVPGNIGLSGLARLPGRAPAGQRCLHVLPATCQGRPERRHGVRQERPGIRAAQLRVPAGAIRAGPRPHARRPGRGAPRLSRGAPSEWGAWGAPGAPM